MRDEYELDRRANALYDAAMAFKRAQDWQAYTATMIALENVYAAIRRHNAQTYPKIDGVPRLERIKAQAKPMRPSEARRHEQVVEILRRDGEVKAASLIRELHCARSSVYFSLYWLEARGMVDRSIRGVWRLREDDSA